MDRKRLRAACVTLGMAAGLALAATVPGCAVAGFAAARLTPPRVIQAAYKDMAKQRVAVVVWTDRQTTADFGSLQLDVSGAVQQKLKVAAAAESKELEGIAFPYKPQEIVTWQRQHPELFGMPPATVGGKLKGATRVIYIELRGLSVQPTADQQLFRGTAEASISVVEVRPDGTTNVVSVKPDLRSKFPDRAPAEGLPNLSASAAYSGIIDALSTDAAKLFFSYDEERRPEKVGD